MDFLLKELVINKDKAYHAHYRRCDEVAKFGRRITTGKNHDEYVLSFKSRETNEQKKQRIKLYIPRTKDVEGRIDAIYEKVHSTRPQENEVRIDDDAAKEAIAMNQSNFTDGKTLFAWLNENYKLYNRTDCNAWIILSAEGEAASDTVTSAVVVPTQSVIYRSYNRGILDILGVKEVAYGKTKELECYYIYTNDTTYKYTEYDKDEMQYEDGEVVRVNNQKSFYKNEYINYSGRIGAICIGYNPDVETMNETYVQTYDKASELFKDLINSVSEQKLAKALHLFLQKFQIAEPCDYVDEHSNVCEGGRIGKKTCSSCGGSGLKIHTTTQDVILVKSNEFNDESFINLKDRIYYPTLPFDIVNKIDADVEKCEKAIPIAVFGIDINERDAANVTATAINNYYDSINRVLGTYARGLAQKYKFIVEQIALNKGYAKPVVKFEYPETFDILTIHELLTLLGHAIDKNANHDTISNIQFQIIEKQNTGDPIGVHFAKLKDWLTPFKTLSDDMIKFKIAASADDDPYVIAYLYNDTIFSNIKMDQDLFNEFVKPETNKDRVKEIFDEEVAKIAEQIRDSQVSDTGNILRDSVASSDIDLNDDEE